MDFDNANRQRTTLMEHLTIAAWNIRGITPKMSEIILEIKKRKIDVLIVTETKKKTKGSDIIDDYLFIYSGVEQNRRASAGVGILIRKELKKRIIGYSWYNEHIITLKFKSGRSHYYVIGAYAPK